MTSITRQEYAGLFGPTTGDKIRLGDTDLYVEIEKDLRVYGDEALYGGGKTLRDGMGMDNQLTSAGGALDLVITNVVVVDATIGVVKADVGIKDGKIVGIGKAGNPGLMFQDNPLTGLLFIIGIAWGANAAGMARNDSTWSSVHENAAAASAGAPLASRS